MMIALILAAAGVSTFPEGTTFGIEERETAVAEAGALRLALGDHDRALDGYRRGTDPALPEGLRLRARFGEGITLATLGLPEAAVEAFAEVAASTPGTPRGERIGARAVEWISLLAPSRLASREVTDGRWWISRGDLDGALAGFLDRYHAGEIRLGPAGTGIIIREMPRDSFPARHGLKEYDIIRSVQGRPLLGVRLDELARLLGNLTTEERITVELERFSPERGETVVLEIAYEILSPREMLRRERAADAPEGS